MCRLMCVMMAGAAWMLLAVACGSSNETEADRIGVGAECNEAGECESPDEELVLDCLTQFKGGYCGLEGCAGDSDCPEGSACVAHSDAENYCFRLCQDKPECNRHRSSENEANCSANIEFVDGKMDRKACVPPSSGD